MVDVEQPQYKAACDAVDALMDSKLTDTSKIAILEDIVAYAEEAIGEFEQDEPDWDVLVPGDDENELED